MGRISDNTETRPVRNEHTIALPVTHSNLCDLSDGVILYLVGHRTSEASRMGYCSSHFHLPVPQHHSGTITRSAQPKSAWTLNCHKKIHQALVTEPTHYDPVYTSDKFEVIDN